jgi:polar amino acid transport system substrate-binding protein
MAACAAFIAFAPQAQAQETLRIGPECTCFPFNFRDSDGELKGYDIDVAGEIAKRLNAKTEYSCLKFGGLIPALLAGRFDLIAASLSITPQRKVRIGTAILAMKKDGTLEKFSKLYFPFAIYPTE